MRIAMNRWQQEDCSHLVIVAQTRRVGTGEV
jgi:hypothetical protein